MSKILVFAEQRDGELKKVVLENLTLARNLAREIGTEYITVLIGKKGADFTQTLGKYGAQNIVSYQNDKLAFYNSEGYSKLLADAVKEHDAKIVGMSALLTTTMPNMGRTIEAFIDADLRDEVRFMVGGAPVTSEFADDMGADAYGETAVDCVDQAKRLKELEIENQRLKKLLADAELDKEILKEAMKGNF